jgi:hypothetical protein
MNDSSDVVVRSDSFIPPDGNLPEASGTPRTGRRRRSFLAAHRSYTEPEKNDLQEVEDDDLPVLTEIVPVESPVVEEPSAQAATQQIDEEQVLILATEIVQAIGKQMAYELPSLLEATLLNASEELRAGIASTMETALRDYIARRKQLALPLEDPGAE